MALDIEGFTPKDSKWSVPTAFASSCMSQNPSKKPRKMLIAILISRHSDRVHFSDGRELLGLAQEFSTKARKDDEEGNRESP